MSDTVTEPDPTPEISQFVIPVTGDIRYSIKVHASRNAIFLNVIIGDNPAMDFEIDKKQALALSSALLEGIMYMEDIISEYSEIEEENVS